MPETTPATTSSTMAPHIETLCKAGYEFAKDFHTFNNIKEDACTLFNRLCQVGTKPKNIFKTTEIDHKS